MNTDQNWVLMLLARVGVDIDQLEKQFPDEMRQMLSLDTADAPLDAAYRIMRGSAEQLGNPHLGIEMARQMDFTQVGLYGYLLSNARTLGELLELASHYFNILFHTSRIYFRQGAEESSFEYRIVSPTTQLKNYDIDWSLGTYIHLIRSFIGQSWYPAAVYLSYEAPEDTEPLERFFGQHLFFDQQTNSFEIDNDMLSIKINDSDPGLLKIIKDQADQLLSSWVEDDSIYHRVRLMIMQGMEEEGFNADVLARRMGMSISTLKRRLAEHQLSFRGIRDELVDSLAKQALKDTSLPVGHISAQLGYSEPAAFDRAFKRLVGLTPREYRKRCQEVKISEGSKPV